MKKYVIINNEVHVTNCIKTMLDSYEGMSYKGSANKQEAALNLILKTNPDLIFLNIDGIIENLTEFLLDTRLFSLKQPTLVALSNTKDFAYKAFKYDFFDYLLTPLSEVSLRKSVLRYQKKHFEESRKTICLKSHKDYHYLSLDDILFLKADNNTTDFYMNDDTVIGAYKTLKTFENILPDNFLRIHKSYIVNSELVSRIHYGKGMCVMKNRTHKIPFTKTFADNIELINAALANNSYMAIN